MTLLGMDTSAGTCTAAISRDGKILASFARRDGLTHSETLLPGVLSLLDKTGLEIIDLDGLALSVGPGSFTGLRIGISTVKGLAYADDLPCVPVSTLAALGENARALSGAAVCAVMDARRGEFYNALFRVENGSVSRLTEDRAISGEILANEIADMPRLCILGDGAEKFVTLFPRFADYLAPESIRFQSGESVCRLAEQAFEKDRVSCRLLSPRYLRLPQAEREWLLNKQQ